jgi:hypothetical protein
VFRLAEVLIKSFPMIITWPSNGGAGLTGKGGRKTANACDKSAKETSMDTAAHFMFVAKKTSQKV